MAIENTLQLVEVGKIISHNVVDLKIFFEISNFTSYMYQYHKGILQLVAFSKILSWRVVTFCPIVFKQHSNVQ